MNRHKEVAFEEALSDEWAGGLQVAEVRITSLPLVLIGITAVVFALIIAARVSWLAGAMGKFYTARARNNLSQLSYVAPPRGRILDRNGYILADNRLSHTALLDVKTYLQEESRRSDILEFARNVFSIQPEDLQKQIEQRSARQITDPIVLAEDIPQELVKKIADSGMPGFYTTASFKRDYANGPEFSSVIGYTALVNVDDINTNPTLTSQDDVGRAGVERYYEWYLRGEAGKTIRVRDAKGRIIEEQRQSEPSIGPDLTLTIDGEFQRYLYKIMKKQLDFLGRTDGVAIAMNPQNGEILAMLNFPTYDNNIFVSPARKSERGPLMVDNNRPLFNRAVSGLYSPASTIKPVVGVAALAEKVIDPFRSIFSPGYIDVPNPYHPESPTRYLDWRYQGYVDLSQAIAKSSDVYFYAVVGGTPELKGMGITKLRSWWQRFGLGSITGVDMPGEESGFLPDPAWKEKRTGRAWTIGDSYNVAIGQGDLLATPLQILNYSAAIANDGKLWKPFLSKTHGKPELLNDLSQYSSFIEESRKGMREAVTSPEGTAYKLNDLPISVGAKTGTAQIKNKTQENSFTVAFAPYDNPQIVILVLIENARAKTLNTVPVVKEALYWYEINRLGAKGRPAISSPISDSGPIDSVTTMPISTASGTPAGALEQ